MSVRVGVYYSRIALVRVGGGARRSVVGVLSMEMDWSATATALVLERLSQDIHERR